MFKLCISKSTFSYEFSLTNPKLSCLKIDVSCDFRQFSSHPASLTKSHACHKICVSRSPDNAIRQKHATRHVWSAAPTARNDDGSLQSAAPATKIATHLLKTMQKILRLPHKTTFDTLRNTSECHKVARLPRETRLRDIWNLQKWPLLQSSP